MSPLHPRSSHPGWHRELNSSLEDPLCMWIWKLYNSKWPFKRQNHRPLDRRFFVLFRYSERSELPWRSQRLRWPDGPSKKGRIHRMRIPSLQKLRWWDRDVLVVHICGEKVGSPWGCGKNEQTDVGIKIRVRPGGNTYCTRRPFD